MLSNTVWLIVAMWDCGILLFLWAKNMLYYLHAKKYSKTSNFLTLLLYKNLRF